MNGSALAAVKAWLTLPSSDANRHESRITTSAKVAHLPMCYTTDTVIVRANKEIHNFKAGSLMLWNFPQNLLDPTLRSSGVHNMQTL